MVAFECPDFASYDLTSLRTGVLQTQAHDDGDQLLQVCLTLHRLRHSEHG